MRTLTPVAVRRIALAAQGFADPPPAGAPTRRHLSRVLSRVKLLQLDSVNVVARAHYLSVFSRLGSYDRRLLDDAAWAHTARRPRLLVEYWAHEASLVPVADWPLLRSGAKKPGWWVGYGRLAQAQPQLVADVLAAVKELGPLTAGVLERELGGTDELRRRAGSWWNRSDVKRVCEWLFGLGELTTASRQGFERRYDLPERVLPPEVLAAPVPEAAAAARRLVTRAAAALGVATEPDLRDYYRLDPARSRAAVAELAADGVLEPVEVPGWRRPGYRHCAARIPRRIRARALLCPFDPLIWERDRTERIFDGFRYRVEIYTPAPRRRHGYYVFPFLLDDALVARVDLKADRAAGLLRVPAAFAEPGADSARVAAELATALRDMAGWLELEGVAVGERGDLAAPLADALNRQGAAGPRRSAET